MVDDAFHYLKSRGLHGKHNTSESPLISPMDVPIEPTNDFHENKNDPPVLLFVLTASDKGGIERYGTELKYHLQQLPNTTKQAGTQYLLDLAFTLAKKRSMLPWKSFVLGQSLEHLQESLSTLISTPLRASGCPLLRFVFTGQGAQWPSMGRELLKFQVFKDSLQRADSYFRSLGSTWSLLGTFKYPRILCLFTNKVKMNCTALRSKVSPSTVRDLRSLCVPRSKSH